MEIHSGSHSAVEIAGVDNSVATISPWSQSASRPARLNARLGCALAFLVVLGAIGISPALTGLWDIWTSDPLQSIGMLIVAAGFVLTLRVWRQWNWELRGTWWGILPLALSFVLVNLRHEIAWSLIAGIKLDLFAPKTCLYLFGSGVVLLFAGTRVWRQAWFPLALLLFAQPVPAFITTLVDLPLQSLAAHIARSFASLIGFPPTNPDLLHLMFTPDFGMFIAPGCDGMRGAVTMGYAALIVGYLKRVSYLRWFFYVAGAVILGHLFNLFRLCALVLYYRIALGHHALEHVAKQADYVIGGSIILVAAFLLIWLVSRKEPGEEREAARPSQPSSAVALSYSAVCGRAAAFLVIGLLFAAPGVDAFRHYRKSFAASIRDGEVTRADLDSFMPRQIGDYKLKRTGQEESNGRLTVESAAYTTGNSGEAIVGVWLLPSGHTMHDSWRSRGQGPEMRDEVIFATANGVSVRFDTAFYSDGITDSFAGTVYCTPTSCSPSHPVNRVRMEFALDPIDFSTRGRRAVSIFFRIEKPHSDEPRAAVYNQLSLEAQRFVAGLDFTALSRKFQ